MIELDIIKYGITGLLGVLMWFIKRTVDDVDARVKELKAEIDDIKITYLHKNDFREFKQELRGMFDDLKKDIHAIQNSVNLHNKS